MNTAKKPLTGLHVLLWMLGFFAVVGGVNGVFVYSALSTFNGETSKSAYVDGLAYNDTLHRVEAQRALGWHVETDFTPSAGRVAIAARFRDRAGMSITGLAVSASFVRPAQEGDDFTVPLSPQGEGLYTAETAVPLPGQWQVRLVAEGAGIAAPYVLEYRTVVR